MEKYARAFERFKKAFGKFREVIENSAIPDFFKEEFIIEITTKRFEYTYEAMWKSVKEFLRLRGIECNSPRSCFGELIKEGVISEDYEGILADMIVLRNSLVHIYDEQRAKEIYQEIENKNVLEIFGLVLEALNGSE